MKAGVIATRDRSHTRVSVVKSVWSDLKKLKMLFFLWLCTKKT